MAESSKKPNWLDQKAHSILKTFSHDAESWMIRYADYWGEDLAPFFQAKGDDPIEALSRLSSASIVDKKQSIQRVKEQFYRQQLELIQAFMDTAFPDGDAPTLFMESRFPDILSRIIKDPSRYSTHQKLFVFHLTHFFEGIAEKYSQYEIWYGSRPEAFIRAMFHKEEYAFKGDISIKMYLGTLTAFFENEHDFAAMGGEITQEAQINALFHYESLPEDLLDGGPFFIILINMGLIDRQAWSTDQEMFRFIKRSIIHELMHAKYSVLTMVASIDLDPFLVIKNELLAFLKEGEDASMIKILLQSTAIYRDDYFEQMASYSGPLKLKGVDSETLEQLDAMERSKIIAPIVGRFVDQACAVKTSGLPYYAELLLITPIHKWHRLVNDLAILQRVTPVAHAPSA
ncbi:MAG: hypothetical protein HQL53_04055 [Magnetococcales bacterium]|nr:hypothetical protein [Magnetococcales bacterium]